MTTTERLAATSKMSLDLRTQIALLARMLHREGYDDNIMGHVSHSLVDGSFLCTPWAMTWDEMLPSHILHIGADGEVLENIAWPDEPLPAFAEQLGASYASLWSEASETTPPVELVAALHTVPAGPGPQMTVLQRVNDPMGFLSNVVVKLPPDHPVEPAKTRGLEHRDRFESNLLLTAGWSPCR
jgi:hypothetical protein